MRSRDTVLFDINETVLDLGGLRPTFAAVFEDENAVSAWFAGVLHSSAVCALTQVSIGFAALAEAALDALAARRNVEVAAPYRAAILNGFANLTPHADVLPALQRLRANGYRCVAFSNSSLELLTQQISCSGLSAEFDEVVSVEQTGSFKPAAKVYHYAAERVQRAVSDLRLIAAHDWDTHGAISAGLLAAYVDRSRVPYNPHYCRPDVRAPSLNEVVTQIWEVDART